MKNHINEASSSMKPKPRDFEFNFDWERTNFGAFDQTTAKKNDLSDVQWNFSNLDRGDRIHMVFTTLQDNFSSDPQAK